MTDLFLNRFILNEKFTIGKLLIGETFFCYALEDPVRPKGIKIAGDTAIPYGRYEVTIDYSNRFKKMMPHILDVPMFEGIRIHSGNRTKDTLGCLLVGTRYDKDQVLESHVAFELFMPKLEDALKKGKVFITIS